MAHHLTTEQLGYLQYYANQNDPESGWNYLAALGDKYAEISAKVVSQDPKYKNEMFHKVVQNHWVSVVGHERTEQLFQTVAAQHFRQYVEILQTGYWPDSDQILMSYVQAARDNGLPDKITFDETWVKSGFNKFIHWEGLLGIESSRIVEPSHVCASINRFKAFFKVMHDMSSLIF